MIPKKHVPDVIRDGDRFSDKIVPDKINQAIPTIRSFTI